MAFLGCCWFFLCFFPPLMKGCSTQKLAGDRASPSSSSSHSLFPVLVQTQGRQEVIVLLGGSNTAGGAEAIPHHLPRRADSASGQQRRPLIPCAKLVKGLG